MSALMAIIHDTWRQSKHQWVMIMLIAVVAIYVPIVVFMLEVREAPDGSKFLGTVFMKETAQNGMEGQWNGVYAKALRKEMGYDDEISERSEKLNEMLDYMQDLDFEIKLLQRNEPSSPKLKSMMDEYRELERQRDKSSRDLFELRKYIREEVTRLTELRTADVSKLQKGVEWWLADSATFLFSVSLILYIFVCAGYIPNMIESGSVDLVLSKPVRRWHIYFGKYLGGLLLYSTVLMIAYLLIFVGVGFKTGVWHWAFFGALPMTLFSIALLYALIAWVGLWTRSTLMSAILGLVYYVIIDSAIGWLGDSGSLPFVADIPAVKQMAEIVKFIFPSFVWLRESATAAVLSVNVFPWKHVIVGLVWLVVCLGTSYNRFRINDY